MKLDNKYTEANLQKILQNKLNAVQHTPTPAGWGVMDAQLNLHHKPEPSFFDGVIQQKIDGVRSNPTAQQWAAMDALLDNPNALLQNKINATTHTPTPNAWNRMSALLDTYYTPNVAANRNHVVALKKILLTTIGVLLCFYTTELHNIGIKRPENTPKIALKKSNTIAKTTKKWVAMAENKNLVGGKVFINDLAQSIDNQFFEYKASELKPNNIENVYDLAIQPMAQIAQATPRLNAKKTAALPQIKKQIMGDVLQKQFAEMVKKQDQENNVIKKNTKKSSQNASDIHFCIKAAAVYYAAYNADVNHYEASISPAFGAFISKNMNPKWGIQSGIEYKQLIPRNLYHAEVMVTDSRPTVDYQAVRNTEVATKLHFIEIPLQINHQITQKSVLSSGIKGAYMLGNQFTKIVDTLQVGTNPLLPTNTAPTTLGSGYQRNNENLQKISLQLILGYEYAQTQRLATGIRFARSFGSLKQLDYYNDVSTHRNTDLQIYLKYTLK
jgi:hypothetical protein